jgi:hypothetical protein
VLRAGEVCEWFFCFWLKIKRQPQALGSLNRAMKRELSPDPSGVGGEGGVYPRASDAHAHASKVPRTAGHDLGGVVGHGAHVHTAPIPPPLFASPQKVVASSAVPVSALSPTTTSAQIAARVMAAAVASESMRRAGAGDVGGTVEGETDTEVGVHVVSPEEKKHDEPIEVVGQHVSTEIATPTEVPVESPFVEVELGSNGVADTGATETDVAGTHVPKKEPRPDEPRDARDKGHAGGVPAEKPAKSETFETCQKRNLDESSGDRKPDDTTEETPPNALPLHSGGKEPYPKEPHLRWRAIQQDRDPFVRNVLAELRVAESREPYHQVGDDWRRAPWLANPYETIGPGYARALDMPTHEADLAEAKLQTSLPNGWMVSISYYHIPPTDCPYETDTFSFTIRTSPPNRRRARYRPPRRTKRRVWCKYLYEQTVKELDSIFLLNTFRLPVCPYSSCEGTSYDQKGVFPRTVTLTVRLDYSDCLLIPIPHTNPGYTHGRETDTFFSRPRCGSPEDEASFVLCDSCPKGGHFACLGLPSVPQGDWFCVDCGGDPAPVPATPARANGQKTVKDKKNPGAEKSNTAAAAAPVPVLAVAYVKPAPPNWRNRTPLQLGKELEERPMWGMDCYTRVAIDAALRQVPAFAGADAMAFERRERFFSRHLMPAVHASWNRGWDLRVAVQAVRKSAAERLSAEDCSAGLSDANLPSETLKPLNPVNPKQQADELLSACDAILRAVEEVDEQGLDTHPPPKPAKGGNASGSRHSKRASKNPQSYIPPGVVIKRPLGAYMIYACERRQGVLDAHPEWETKNISEIGKALGAGWKALGELEKQGFHEKAKLAKKQFEEVDLPLAIAKAEDEESQRVEAEALTEKLALEASAAAAAAVVKSRQDRSRRRLQEAAVVAAARRERSERRAEGGDGGGDLDGNGIFGTRDGVGIAIGDRVPGDRIPGDDDPMDAGDSGDGDIPGEDENDDEGDEDLEEEIKRYLPPGGSNRRASAHKRRHFRLHPKGVGVVCIDPNGIEPGTYVQDYLGELYTPWRWYERQVRVGPFPNPPDCFTEAADCCPYIAIYSYQKGRLTSALTVCPYIAIHNTDTFLSRKQDAIKKRDPGKELPDFFNITLERPGGFLVYPNPGMILLFGAGCGVRNVYGVLVTVTKSDSTTDCYPYPRHPNNTTPADFFLFFFSFFQATTPPAWTFCSWKPRTGVRSQVVCPTAVTRTCKPWCSR